MNGCSCPAVPVGRGTQGIGTGALTYPSVRPLRQVAPVLTIGLVLLTLFAPREAAQEQQVDWQVQVRKYCDASDWTSAMRVVDQQIARSPNDLDLKAWRARVLAWSGNLAQAQEEYLAILTVSPNDPDTWAGLANVNSQVFRPVNPPH